MGVICSFTFLFLLWNENGKRERGKQDEVIIGVNDKQDEAKGGTPFSTYLSHITYQRT